MVVQKLPLLLHCKGGNSKYIKSIQVKFCNGRDETFFFFVITLERSMTVNCVTACYQHVRTYKPVSGIRTMWFSWMNSFLGSVCRSKFPGLTKSMFHSSHWTLAKFHFIPRSPFHNRFLCRLSYPIIWKSLQRNITPERSRDTLAAVTGRDMGSYPHQKDCSGILKVFGSSQHRFMKGKSCLNNLTAFHKEMTGLADKGRTVDVVYLEFGEAFNIASYNIPLRQADEVQSRWIDSDWNLAELLGSDSCDQQLEANHSWCAPGASTGFSPVKHH